MPVPRPLTRFLLAAPGVPDERRVALASAAAAQLRAAGRAEQADELVAAAARRVSSPRLRSELLVAAVHESHAVGRPSSLARSAYRATLTLADQQLTAGDKRAAAETFTEALRIATHRLLHFDSTTSPLADDPRGFTEPLRDSTVAQMVRAPRGRRTASPGLSGPVDGARPVRLLIATRINADFLAEIREHFDVRPDFETRFVDFAEAHELDRFAKKPEKIVLHTLTGEGRLGPFAEDAFRAHLEWADVVFVEWCTALAALLTQVDPGDTRIIVRMHSYEAFTLWPHLMDFSRVDDVIFVSGHLRDLAVAAIPGLEGPQVPRQHVITNAVDLQRCVRPKDDDARYTLGVIGASKMVKDPRWAIAVLRELRKHDHRYRLVLVRGDLEEPTQAAEEYVAAFRRDLAELEPSGAVEVLGHTDDIPGALEKIGVAISSSARESFHIGFVEAVASGAVPVVRDWPFFPGAAGDLFPADWVVDSPERAAERVLALTETEALWRQAGAAAAQHVLEKWDWSVVALDFEELFRGGKTPT